MHGSRGTVDHGTSDVVVDLSRVTFMGAQGVTLLVRLRSQVGASGGELSLQHTNRIAEFYLEHGPEVAPLWFQGTPTLVHGDAHIGNLFVDTIDDGRTGFLDWAVVCAAPGVRDVAHLLCNSVPVELREDLERGVVERYCAAIADAGHAVDLDDTWDSYCVQALYSWVAAVSIAGMGSKWQASDIGLSASARATAACTHLRSVDVATSRLG